MKILFSLLFTLLLFLCQSQEKQNDIKVLQDKITEYENLGDTLNNNYLIESNNLAHLFEDQKNYVQAENIFLKTLRIRQKYLGLYHLDVATSLIHLSDLYSNQGKYVIAEPFCINSLEIREKFLGKKNSVCIKTLGKLAYIYLNENKYDEAEKLYLQGLELKKEIFEENDPSILLSLKNLTSLYSTQGKYLEAEKYLNNIAEIKKNLFGKKSEEYITSLNELAVAYFYQGKYSDSESLQINLLKLQKESFGEKNIDFASYLNNLAELYREQNKFDKAEILYEKALNILTEINKTDDKVYLKTLSNLALLYTQTGYNLEAEPILKKIIDLVEQKDGIESANYATALNNLGALYSIQKKYNDAERNLAKTVEIRKKILSVNHPDYALSLSNLASLYRILNQFSKSLALNLEAYKITDEVLGKNHSAYISSIYSLAGNYQDLKLQDNANIYFNQFITTNQDRFVKDFYGSTEQDITNILKIYNEDLIRPFSFLNNFSKSYPDINLNLYDNLLLINNLSQRNRTHISKAIQKSGSQNLRDKYQEFISNKVKLNKLNELPLDIRPDNFDTLTEKTEQLEKELSKESTLFLDYQNAMSLKFRDVKNKLTKTEVALNVVSFRYYNKKVTDSIIYAAFIIKKNSKFPKFISLYEEKQLQSVLEFNKNQPDSNRIDKQYTNKTISDLFLKSLEKELEGISTIYLSPSGLGHQIDFAALPLSENQTFGEKYELHILSSPAELIDYKDSKIEKKSNVELLLYGGINYNNYSAKNEITYANEEEVDDISVLKTRSSITKFDYLNGTNNEVKKIQSIGTENGFATTILNEDKATEESIKALDGRTNPFVLHLATHGFFFPDPPQEIPKDILLETGKSKIYKTSDDPMMRSGLLFAGANNFWNKENLTSTTDDGILTASEISNLDLSACQLVVLSACETALGELKGSEGVFGLQRAFKMAGVKNIIMSLWKVPDTQTAELFEIFYSECFTGKTIHEAFQTAQSKMKAKYSPYCWAGFVLLE